MRGHVKGNDDRDPLLGHAARKLSDDSSPGPACLQAETVAAWAEDRLPRHDVAALEAHAAGCARCRALLAAFARTEPTAVPAVPWWKAPVMRWATPVAAVAAAAIIWVAVDQRSEPDSAGAPVADSSEPQVLAERTSETGPPSAPPAEEPAQARARQPAGRPEPPAGQSAAALKEAAPSPPPAPAPPVPPAAEAARAEAVTSDLAADALAPRGAFPLVVSTPDGSIQWRTQPGRIERSTDKGATWDALPLAPGLTLTTGRCVTADTCWLAGRDGAVLRTTDGRTWSQTARPDPAHIVSIQPADALNAAVTTADGRIFVTADGGLTWALQEILAAPF